MNFNKDLIHNLEGQNIKKTLNEVKSVAENFAKDVMPENTKDLSDAIKAQDSIGRASFSIMKGNQGNLAGKVDNIITTLGYKNNSSSQKYLKDLVDFCKTDGEYNEDFVNIAEKVCNLSKNKPIEQQDAQEIYLPVILNLCKTSDGKLDKEISDSIMELMENDKISTRGVSNIIEGCTEYLKDRNGNFTKKFNKHAFEKYRELQGINEQIGHISDDSCTIYTGKIYNSAIRNDVNSIRQGEEYIFDEVAFNFGKHLFKQDMEVTRIDGFMKTFRSYTDEGGKTVMNGFKFTPSRDFNYTKIIQDDILKSLKSKYKSGSGKIEEACKTNGEYSLHNLLVADTLSEKVSDPSYIADIMNTLRGEDGLIPTDLISYLLKNEGKLSNTDAITLKNCMRENGSVDGYVYNKVRSKTIESKYIDKCKDISGEINYDNIDVLEILSNGVNEGKYSPYQVEEILDNLKNKKGVIDKNLLEPLDELLKYDSYAPKVLKKCLNENNELDKMLFNLQKDILSKKIYVSDGCWAFVKNPDGSTNINGVDAIKTLLNKDMLNYYSENLINTFQNNSRIDINSLNKFTEENKTLGKNIYYNALRFAEDKNKKVINISDFNAYKEVASKPEISTLLSNNSTSRAVNELINLKMKPETLSRDVDMMYELSHLTPDNTEILERNGLPGKFYSALAKGDTHLMNTDREGVKSFEQSFVNTSRLEKSLENLDFTKNIELNYSKNDLTNDIKKSLEKLNERQKNDLKRAFNISVNKETGIIEGFPRYFNPNTTAPTTMEKEFEKINSAINKFYTSGIKSDSPELKSAYEEIMQGFPEFSMIIGEKAADGTCADIKALKDLVKLAQSPEYKALSESDKTVSKITILMNSLKDIDKKPSRVTRNYMTDNDGAHIKIDASWKKNAEYANSVLERYNLSEQEKYRITQLLNDLGWAKEYKAGNLTAKDIAINQRYRGDEIVSPLLEKVINNEHDINVKGLNDELKNMRKNQQILMLTKLSELEPYIQTTTINGRELKYVDLNKAELQDTTFLAHFLGYDRNDHTLNLLKNKAYRTSWSASLLKGGNDAKLFAGRNTGIVFEPDNVNISNVNITNIDSGFGKQYESFKESLNSNKNKYIKNEVMEDLNLNENEYGELMEKIINANGEIDDCVINGRKIRKEDIMNAHKKGIGEIFENESQNETTVLNPRPAAIIGIGDDLNDRNVADAIDMAQNNNMLLLIKKKQN